MMFDCLSAGPKVVASLIAASFVVAAPDVSTATTLTYTFDAVYEGYELDWIEDGAGNPVAADFDPVANGFPPPVSNTIEKVTLVWDQSEETMDLTVGGDGYCGIFDGEHGSAGSYSSSSGMMSTSMSCLYDQWQIDMFDGTFAYADDSDGSFGEYYWFGLNLNYSIANLLIDGLAPESDPTDGDVALASMPVPASLPLLAAGLFGFGALRRFKRA